MHVLICKSHQTVSHNGLQTNRTEINFAGKRTLSIRSQKQCRKLTATLKKLTIKDDDDELEGGYMGVPIEDDDDSDSDTNDNLVRCRDRESMINLTMTMYHTDAGSGGT